VRIPVETTGEGTDGVGIRVLLHVLDGYLNELEIFVMDGQLLNAFPDPDDWVVKTFPSSGSKHKSRASIRRSSLLLVHIHQPCAPGGRAHDK
jgi:hypothetical protein